MTKQGNACGAKGWVTRVEIGLVNWQQEEPAGFDKKGGTSRISREAYVRFCEGLGVKFPGPTRRDVNSICVLLEEGEGWLWILRKGGV